MNTLSFRKEVLLVKIISGRLIISVNVHLHEISHSVSGKKMFLI